MPVKKKAGGKKKKKVPEGPVAEPEPPAPGPPWITLSVRLVTWGYLNFTLRVPLATTIFELRERIVARHGGSISAGEVCIYREAALGQRVVLEDLMVTLAELGFGPGAPEDDLNGEEDGDSNAELFYDFKPMVSDCPLVLCEPPNLRFAAEMRRVAKADEEKRVKEEARAQKEEARHQKAISERSMSQKATAT